MDYDFIKMCFEGFKKNDKKFPKDWTLDDYKKYTEACNIILEKENEEKTFQSNRRNSQVF